MEQKKDVITQWSESAPYWEKHRTVVREMFAPVSQALIDDARIVKGQAVLDVAMGPGEPALTLAEAVGRDGKVMGTDAVAEMVEAARREAGRRGLKNASFETAVGEKLPFADNSFDAAVSRFGVMFFPSPAAGVREILRVLKPGGRLAMAVWHFAERNSFFTVVTNVLDRYVPPTPPEPDAPDAFRFAQPGALLGIFESAGVKAAFERLLKFSIRAKASPEDFWTLRSELSESMRSKLARLSDAKLAELTREVVHGIRAYSSGEGVSFPSEVLIVSGEKARER
jgi:ubiquinone/menaquinone biosynthesis C-methylase UbiE